MSALSSSLSSLSSFAALDCGSVSAVQTMHGQHEDMQQTHQAVCMKIVSLVLEVFITHLFSGLGSTSPTLFRYVLRLSFPCKTVQGRCLYDLFDVAVGSMYMTPSMFEVCLPISWFVKRETVSYRYCCFDDCSVLNVAVTYVFSSSGLLLETKTASPK